MRYKTQQLFCLVLLLASIGAIFVYSTSAHSAIEKYGDSFFFLKRQLLWIVIGLIAQIVCIKIPLRCYERYAFPLMFFVCFLLVLVLIPQFSVEVGGARRWLSFCGLRFQPSELSKLTTLIFVAKLLQLYQNHQMKPLYFYLSLIAGMGLILFLIIAEKDLGTCVILTTVVWLVLFVSLKKIIPSILILLSSIPFFFMSIINNPFRLRRIFAYLNPWKDPQNTGYQIIQSMMGISRGGIWGQGLGQSVQKHFYLPEAHTDFIFSIYAEEMGLVGALFLMIILLWILFLTSSIVRKSRNFFSYSLASGLIFLIFVQVCINLAVVTALLPTKGTTFPFLSFGGSSLVVHFMMIGLIINIDKNHRIQQTFVTE